MYRSPIRAEELVTMTAREHVALVYAIVAFTDRDLDTHTLQTWGDNIMGIAMLACNR